MSGPTIPGPSWALAIGAVVVMLLAGGGPWLAALVAGAWALSFWLIPRLPSEAAPPSTGVRLSHTHMGELIEHQGLPVLMLEGTRIIIANAAAREAFGGHVVGQDARVALRHPAAVDLLARPEGATAMVQGLTGPRSSWQLTRRKVDERYSLVELVNRTSEADISRAHTDFVANASHELRTPLASIIGYMETLADDGAAVEPARAARFYDTVLREARRLQTLVEDLMSLSRVEAEKHDQPREPVDLAELAWQASRDASGPQGQERLEFCFAGEPLRVRGDRRQLEQLVRNLVDNALKYGSAEAPVTIALTRGQRDMAVFTVADQGEGIASEHLPHLTRRFYRTDPGRSRAAGGTGLGLAIVKHIVERHRGRLDIASKPGAGTTVTVCLPLLQDAAAEPAVASSQDHAPLSQ